MEQERAAVRVDAGFAAFELALDLHVLEEGISGEFLYNTALFDPESIDLLAVDFEALLSQILTHPTARLLALELPSHRQPRNDESSAGRTSIRRFRETQAADPPIGQRPDQRIQESQAMDG